MDLKTVDYKQLIQCNKLCSLDGGKLTLLASRFIFLSRLFDSWNIGECDRLANDIMALQFAILLSYCV